MSDQENSFAQYFLTEASEVEIDLPDGEPMMYEGKRVKVHVYGPSTDKFIRAQERLQREATKNVMAAVAKGKKKEEGDKDADAKFLSEITERFENFPFPGGAEAIYRNPGLKYINKQVQDFVGDMGNFFKNGAKT